MPLGAAVASPPESDGETGEQEKPTLSEAPLEAPANDDVGERMRARLVELDATSDDSDYLGRLLDVAAWTEELWEGGRTDDAYRALLVMADHAVGSGGRSGPQARAAAATFGSVARGELLENLIQRATSPGTTGIRAARLLLQLGETAVPAILSRLAQEEDSDCAAPLRALVLTQGDTALGALLDGIRSADDARACLCLRLAGELQNPLVLPAILNALRSPHMDRRLEAIRALGLLPGDEARAALTAALGSDEDEVASSAARTLADRSGEWVVGTLLGVLEEAAREGRTRLACAVVEVLGRIGDERAVPRLCALLDRKPLLRRAHWYSIQLVAVDALAGLPTREARRCIDRAARHGTQSIRARARAALGRDEADEAAPPVD